VLHFERTHRGAVDDALPAFARNRSSEGDHWQCSRWGSSREQKEPNEARHLPCTCSPARDAGGTRRRSHRLSHSPGRPCTRYLQPGDSSRQQRNERVGAGVRLPHSSHVSGRTLGFAPDLRAGFLAGQRNPTTGQSWRKVATVPRPRESPNRARGSLWKRKDLD
jgi:hypothetical protein